MTGQSKSTPAETAVVDCVPNAGKRKRGRPKATTVPRAKSSKLDIEEAIDALTEVAAVQYHPHYSWDGKSYPKTNRSYGPIWEALQDHHLVLKILIQLPPNGYPDKYGISLYLAGQVWVSLKVSGCRRHHHHCLSSSGCNSYTLVSFRGFHQVETARPSFMNSSSACVHQAATASGQYMCTFALYITAYYSHLSGNALA